MKIARTNFAGIVTVAEPFQYQPQPCQDLAAEQLLKKSSTPRNRPCRVQSFIASQLSIALESEAWNLLRSEVKKPLEALWKWS